MNTENNTTKKKSIYVAGPMSGYENFNFPAFNAAAQDFAACGWVVFNPAAKDTEKHPDIENNPEGDPILAAEKDGFNFREAYTWDVTKVIEADAICMLRGWEQSPGARGEHAVAVAMKRHYPEYEIFYEN